LQPNFTKLILDFPLNYLTNTMLIFKNTFQMSFIIFITLMFSTQVEGRESSCSQIWDRYASYRDLNGIYRVEINGQERQVYCDMVNGGWTLVARFSNSDAHNWISSGDLWYNRTEELGTATDPTVNADAMGAAFFGVEATEFRITRTDSTSHNALLTTTNNCLQGRSVRDKIASFGDFTSGVWASDAVRGNCSAIFENEYQSTKGFRWVGASGCEIGDPNGISFFADWSGGDGAVIMIGAGGTDCGRADHGIGITEANAAAFGEDAPGAGASIRDFGGDYGSGSTTLTYGLNMWVRNDDYIKSELGYVDYTTCEWHQLNKMNKVINSEDFFGFECPANEIISDLRLQGYTSSTVLSNNPTAVLCCKLGGYSAMTNTCVDSFSSADGNLEAAVCEGNSALVAMYDLADPTLQQSQWQYQATKGITCCDIEYDTDYGRNANLGIDRNQCQILSHSNTAVPGTFDVACPDDMILVEIIDDDFAHGVQSVHEVECCRVHNFEAPSQAPTQAPTTSLPTQAPTTACYDCLIAVHGRQASISGQDAFVDAIESCLSLCCVS